MIWIVVSQSLLAVTGVTLLLIIRAWRALWMARVEKVSPKYMTWIFNEVGGAFQEGAAQKTKIKIPWIDRQLVRDLLLKVIGSMQGAERNAVAALYAEYGYFDRDRAATDSFRFSRRIKALARIESVRPHDCLPLIRKLSRDPVPLIRFSAIRLLLQMKDPRFVLNKSHVDDLVKARRFDTLTEFLKILSTARDPFFFELLQTYPLPRVRDLCLQLVWKEKLVEALPYVFREIETLRKDRLSDGMALILRLNCLSIVPSVENEALLTELAADVRSQVRAAAYRALIVIRPDRIAEFIVKTMEDPSDEVKRVGEIEFSREVRNETT